jgi:hypothetical protein
VDGEEEGKKDGAALGYELGVVGKNEGAVGSAEGCIDSNEGEDVG